MTPSVPTSQESSRPAPGAHRAQTGNDPRVKGPGSKVWRGFKRSAVALILLVLVLIAWAVVLWNLTPAGWARVQEWRQTVPLAKRAAMATDFERALSQDIAFSHRPSVDQLLAISQWSQSLKQRDPGRAKMLLKSDGGPADVRLITMSQNDVNAWFDTRMSDFMNNQGMKLPPGVSQPTVTLDGDRVMLAFRYDGPRLSQVFSLDLRPQLIPGGDGSMQLSMGLQSVRGGQLPLPQGLLTKISDGSGQKTIQSIQASLQGRPIDPVIELPGNPRRELRMIDMRLNGAQADMLVRVDPR